jgi:hypothetical protein
MQSFVVKIIHKHGIYSCKTDFDLSCKIHKMRLTTVWQNSDDSLYTLQLVTLFVPTRNSHSLDGEGMRGFIEFSLQHEIRLIIM